MQRLLKSIENKVSFGRPRYLPPDDPVCERVDDEGHINKALPSGHIGEVADPKQVRCRGPEYPVHLIAWTRHRCVRDGCFDNLSAHRTTDTDLFHQSFNCASGHLEAFPLHLMPRLTNAEDLVVIIPDPFDHGAQLRVPLMPRRSFGRISGTRHAVVTCRWRNRQHSAGRLDAVNNALIFNEGDHRFSGRSSSACAK